MWITSSLQSARVPTNIALGNFDGVHLGHRQVMAAILDDRASQNATSALPLSTSSNASLSTISDLRRPLSSQSVAALHQSIADENSSWTRPTGSTVPANSTDSRLLEAQPLATVVTFAPHPQEYFSGTSRPLLTPIAEKTWQLAQLGIEQLVTLPFDQALAELSPQDFVEQILIKGLNAQQISVGNDFRFGKGRSGSADGLRAIAAKHNIPVTQVSLKHEQGDRISSSRIRSALQTGHPDIAAQLLGRPYTLTGKVVKGKQLGRTIGFPTANLKVPSNKYLPRTGVYSVRVYGVPNANDASATAGIADCGTQVINGVMNIGNRPTVDGQSLSIEVHLLDWAGDLYDQLLTVSLEGFVRAEEKFESIEQLKRQIAADCGVAIAALKSA
ncbi:bifunctional riboflavin kinase/FAD synthetase [cf. Phormidesmis sp. LEGE 11477]|nr:bifunctional riboflavin kinase/FAD synthetase [cf. Phormidesmis sp. LEGE 11477]